MSLVPPRIVPPEIPRGRIAFVAAFIRNPLEVVPRAAYDEDFVAFGGARAPRAWVTSPALVKGVLLDQRDKFRKLTQIRLLGPLLGKGILTSEGAHWKWQRQAAAPLFRPQELGAFVPAFVRAADETLARWRAGPPGAVRNVEEDMTRATFDVIAATLLPSADRAFADEVQRSVLRFQRFGGWDLLYAQLNLPRSLPRPGMFGGPRAVRRLRSMVTQLLRARIASGADPDDLLHRLVAARDPETGSAMDEEQLVDNLLTFYLAGHETTAKALTWTLYLLARSPEWTAALRDEIARVSAGAPLAAGHLDQLVLVQQVIKESMRLYPPAPLMSRQAVEDCEIDGREIRAGTSVLMPIYAIHRHTRRWERPDEFDPARFAPAAEEAMPRYQFMPFGAGPRVCIGRSFALTEATAILATLVAGARFEPVPGHEPTPVARVTLLPKGGMPLKVFATAREPVPTR
jgi:cytochrome P450